MTFYFQHMYFVLKTCDQYYRKKKKINNSKTFSTKTIVTVYGLYINV